MQCCQIQFTNSKSGHIFFAIKGLLLPNSRVSMYAVAEVECTYSKISLSHTPLHWILVTHFYGLRQILGNSEVYLTYPGKPDQFSK